MRDNTKQTIGVIAGTGFSEWFQGENLSVTTDYGQPAADYQRVTVNNGELVFLARHGNPHRFAPHAVNYRANIEGFRQLGVSSIIAVNVVGSIRTEWPSGSLIVPDQVIDYTWGRAHTFFDAIADSEQLLEHIDFTWPYSQPLRQMLLDAAQQIGVAIIDGGCYAATQGPRLETAAEVQRIARDGGDVIGMTGMPEASLAREAGIDYASVCLVSNPAAGIDANSQELSIDEIMQTVRICNSTLKDILVNLCA